MSDKVRNKRVTKIERLENTSTFCLLNQKDSLHFELKMLNQFAVVAPWYHYPFPSFSKRGKSPRVLCCHPCLAPHSYLAATAGTPRAEQRQGAATESQERLRWHAAGLGHQQHV